MVVEERKHSVSFLDFQVACLQIEPAKIHHHQSDVWKTEPKPSQSCLPGHTLHDLAWQVNHFCAFSVSDVHV